MTQSELEREQALCEEILKNGTIVIVSFPAGPPRYPGEL